jgi:hypothetical protein
MPPERAVEVADVHRRLAVLVPAPRSLADSPGILRLDVACGVSLGSCLRRGRPRPPAVPDILGLLARSTRPGWRGGRDIGSDASLRRYVLLLRRSCRRKASASTGCTTRCTARTRSRR